MRVLVVLTLPWQGWIVEPLETALWEAGHEIVSVVHQPQHGHDWLNDATLRAYRGKDPDVVVTPDMPFEPIRRRWPGVRLVSLRHSLASRGNTWDQEHARADAVATWSTWDEKEFGRRGIYVRCLRAGPVWAAPVAMALEVPRDRPRVLWAPSFTGGWSARELVLDGLRLLLAEGWSVRIRPHAVIGWREGTGFAEECTARLGTEPWERSDGSIGPAADLASADALICDVSGISLLALARPGLGQVLVTTPEAERGHRHPGQHDPSGPEWTFRSTIGTVVDVGGRGGGGGSEIAAAVRAAPRDGRAERRRDVARAMMGEDVPGAPARLAAAIGDWARR